MLDHKDDSEPREQTASAAMPKRRSLLPLLKDRRGATAIEFSILAIPFFIIIFAIAETFIAFTGEQLLNTATETMARKLRTGAITYNSGNINTDMVEKDFRTAFCNEISILMRCSATELLTPDRLFIDVRSYSSFSDIPTTLARKGNADNSDIDTTGFGFTPGGGSTINVVRAYYRWGVTADIARPFITNLRPAGSSMPKDYLMVSTAVFVNEKY